MKIFPNEAKQIRITFTCDACGEETLIEIEVPVTGEIKETAVCPVCFKEFEVTVTRASEKSWIEIEDIDSNDIAVAVI